MNGYAFFRSLRMLLGLGLMVLVGLGAFIGFICSQLSLENRFRHNYGADWRVEYERIYGPLSKGHTKIALSAFGILAIGVLLWWLYRNLGLGTRPHARRKSGGHRKRFASELERVIYCRRKALVGVYFGVAGIAAGVLLVLVRMGIFPEHANEIILGIFVFIAGYCAVITGCSWWLKAKGWNEGIVFIGFMPLAILLVPFVRLVLLANPSILLVSMVMMPLVLVVVVTVLPDKSGVSRRRASWEDRVDT